MFAKVATTLKRPGGAALSHAVPAHCENAAPTSVLFCREDLCASDQRSVPVTGERHPGENFLLRRTMASPQTIMIVNIGPMIQQIGDLCRTAMPC